MNEKGDTFRGPKSVGGPEGVVSGAPIRKSFIASIDVTTIAMNGSLLALLPDALLQFLHQNPHIDDSETGVRPHFHSGAPPWPAAPTRESLGNLTSKFQPWTLSVKQEVSGYHFYSLWYKLTWDQTDKQLISGRHMTLSRWWTMMSLFR